VTAAAGRHSSAPGFSRPFRVLTRSELRRILVLAEEAGKAFIQGRVTQDIREIVNGSKLGARMFIMSDVASS
jgi:hypothetical protein